jgi:hypothetical protein
MNSPSQFPSSFFSLLKILLRRASFSGFSNAKGILLVRGGPDDEKAKTTVCSLPEFVPVRSKIEIQAAILFEPSLSDEAPTAQRESVA